MSFLGIKNPFRTGAGDATRAATDATAARQGRAGNLTSFIDSTFANPNREAQTQDFMGALRTQRAGDTNRDFADATRQTKFRTAGQGLIGGSVDASRQKRGLEDVFRRRIGDEAAVQDAGNQLRTQDRGTRQSLINSAYGTADVGQDAQRRLLGGVDNTSMLPGFAMDLGGGLAQGYSRRAEMDAYRRGTGTGAPAPASTPPLYAWNTPQLGGRPRA